MHIVKKSMLSWRLYSPNCVLKGRLELLKALLRTEPDSYVNDTLKSPGMGKILQAEKVKFLDNFVYHLKRLSEEKKNKESDASNEIVMNQYVLIVDK